MIARYGAFELNTITNYLHVTNGSRNPFKYISGQTKEWWWQEKLLEHMTNNAGFFPATHEKITQFCQLMLDASQNIDVLGSWLEDEKYISQLPSNCDKVWLIFLDPFWCKTPWTRALAGKKVLVIHPFAELIEKQYTEKREKLFSNPDILPAFDLKTIKAVQSIGGQSNDFKDWFEALAFMKDEIDKVEFDICLLGCGAYGFPLADYIKSIGKKAFHWGGAVQLLFGIIGRRWEDPSYGKDSGEQYSHIDYPSLVNPYWVRPTQYKTKQSQNVENACYW